MLAVLVFFGIAIQYAHKSDISVGIVCMVNHTALQLNGTNKLNLENDYFWQHKLSESNKTVCLFQNSTTSKDQVKAYGCKF